MLSTRERQAIYEQKQLERLKRAREERERKQAMFERGVPQAKPLTQAQIEEQQAIKQMLLEKKEAQQKSQTTLQPRPDDQAHKFKVRGAALDMPMENDDYIMEDAGPMSLTIVTREMDDFEEQERIINQQYPQHCKSVYYNFIFVLLQKTKASHTQCKRPMKLTRRQRRETLTSMWSSTLEMRSLKFLSQIPRSQR
jgi:hypothetical protein